ncbi:hypothetical protein RA307_29230 [Xanthobacteraceae bacterium Astr-EGSB]|uniref:hypothetical protein n=1 Tax=Astrobacterium formosum TaxID=3069710 RepID=UPI0027B00C5F|nr:hypothetical protein [Xanthobacteraceae bacterium Astr-EGSB]
MNKLLEQAIAELAVQPEEKQEAMASLILDELAAERGWDERFARSEHKLADLARRAKEQHARGQTTPLVFPTEK